MKLFIGENADLWLCGSKFGEAVLIGLYLVHQSMQKVKVIQEILKIEVDEKGLMRFIKKGKHSPRYIVPYRISKRIYIVAKKFEIPQDLATVYPVYHISMLKKCMGDPSLIITTKNVRIKDILSYEEILVQILDRHVWKLRKKRLR